MNNKIYIAGRISGDENYRRKFFDAQGKAEGARFFGLYGWEVYSKTGLGNFRAVNPVTLKLLGKPLSKRSWRVAMAVCLWHLMGCSTVYMLRDWKESRGARIEYNVAMCLGKSVVFEEDEMPQPREGRE